MASEKLSQRLSRIKTRWTTIFKAHAGQGDEPESARQRLLLRYYRPVYRYLRAMVRDEDVAEELTHEFVVRFLRGDFKRADPSRGRFRDLLKRALRHLAIDYWRRKRADRAKTPLPLPLDRWGTPAEADWRCVPPAQQPPAGPDPDVAEADRTFLQGWRAEMLAQAWHALARFQEQTRCPYHCVLRARAEQPKGTSADLARLVSCR